ncbi:hypothetical protein GCM10027082_26000 [Comamonas humi]
MGAVGPQGVPGAPGAQGPKGDTGGIGPTGATGPTGPSGSVASSAVVYKNNTVSTGTNPKSSSVACDAGYKVIGGGATTGEDNTYITDSYPDSGSNAWITTLTRSFGSGNWSVTYHAVCLKVQ